MIPNITLGGVGLLVLVGLLVALLKQLNVPSRWLPAISIIGGMVLGMLAYFDDGITLSVALIGGSLAGAAVSGLYDFGKKTILGN